MSIVKNKVSLITGGTKGIGFGIAESLLDAGAKVAITGRDEKGVKDAVEKLSARGSVIGIVSDVRDLKSGQEVCKQTVAAFGAIDILVANAGIGHFGSIESLTPDQWQETMDVNLTGVFNSVKASLEELMKSKGYIITIASLAGTNFFEGGSAYNASKFGLVGFTQAIMLDLRKYGIKVTTIMPGSVATHFNGHLPGSGDAWKIQPEDIGQMVVDLVRMNPRTLPSKIEVRPSMPPSR